MICNDCAYMNDRGVCVNRNSRYNFGLDVTNQNACHEFESGNSLDENVDADFDDEW